MSLLLNFERIFPFMEVILNKTTKESYKFNKFLPIIHITENIDNELHLQNAGHGSATCAFQN